MATFESGDVKGKRWDEGAMFFTVRDLRFRKMVDDWIQGGCQLNEMAERVCVFVARETPRFHSLMFQAGYAKVWTKGWGEGHDGFERYIGVRGRIDIG